MKRILLLSVISIMGFTACQKPNQNVPSEDKTSESNLSKTMNGSLFNPANPNNPYDSIGYYHNQMVSYYNELGFNLTSPKDSLIIWTNQFVIKNLILMILKL